MTANSVDTSEMFFLWHFNHSMFEFSCKHMSGYNLKKILHFCLRILFTLTNSIDPDEMYYRALHLGSTVCKSTNVPVSGLVFTCCVCVKVLGRCVVEWSVI